MRCAFHPEARAEYLAAVSYLEKQRFGLGAKFTIEIERTIQRIREAPERWPKISGDVRRCLARRFPYGVLYAIESGQVVVLAVMHHSRKPGYWRERSGL